MAMLNNQMVYTYIYTYYLPILILWHGDFM